ncbi:hypothetical protein D4764_16G0008050 [Takifugu flavidus]|uniref:Uncharacterized protein n=1 Tax=Takifugu flavidus TaxID=433684 RepID=A0A5C6NZR3_9TELE|nr:hypothetical protein D4764_16G0008050 [Takifugu flavidus]
MRRGEKRVEEEKSGWRRRKGGGVGGVCKKSAKYKVQQMVKCSYVSSIKITKAGNQKVLQPGYLLCTEAGSGEQQPGVGVQSMLPPLTGCLSEICHRGRGGRPPKPQHE